MNETTPPHDIPEKWAWTKLGNIAHTTSGGTPLRSNKDYYNGDIPWLKSGELNDSVIYSTEETITQEGLSNSSAKIFPKGTLLIALYGATAGKLAFLGVESATNQAVCAIFPDEKIHRKYIYWHLKNITSDLLSKRMGGAQPNLSQRILNTIPIPIPPFPEQLRIVSKLEELFSKLEAAVKSLQRTKTQLERYQQSILTNAFEGRLTKEWRRNNQKQMKSSEEILEQIEDARRGLGLEKPRQLSKLDASELRAIPNCWSWIQINDIAKIIQYGTSEKATQNEDGIPVLRMGNIQDSGLVFDRLKYMPNDWPEKEKFLLDDGDVLFNRTNSAELVGKTAVYRKIYPAAVFASYLIRVKVFDSFYMPDLLSLYINSFYGREYIISVRSQQVGQANVNGTKLAQMAIPLIPMEEQETIMREIGSIFSTIEATEKEVSQSLTRAGRLRQTILKKAFGGELVPQDPSNEHASRLLMRIRQERINRGEHIEQARLDKW